MHPAWLRAALLSMLALTGCARWPAYPGGTDDQPHQAAAQAKPGVENPPPNFGMETLVEAARAGNPKRVKELLSKGASRQTLNEALAAAASFGGLFIALGPDGKPLPYKGQLKAERNVGLGYAQTVRLLLAKGANLETRVLGGETPLMLAAGHGETEVVRVLLEKGAEIEATDSQGMTALAGAACDCAIADMPDTYDSMKLLLDHGANVEAMDRQGYTPLMRAAGFGRTANAQLLLDKRAQIDAANSHGDTALLIAASPNALPTAEVLELLLKRGANIEARNHDGDTALILAASQSGFEDFKIVKLLLDHGADVRAKNNQGRTALDLAVRNGRTKIVALLKTAAAKPH
ncbi:MAG: ankyrin repeat domain-containing protein [Bryobacteraceae bacterium]